MKSILFLAALMALLPLSAMAQNAASPPLVIGHSGDASAKVDDFGWGHSSARTQYLVLWRRH